MNGKVFSGMKGHLQKFHRDKTFLHETLKVVIVVIFTFLTTGCASWLVQEEDYEITESNHFTFFYQKDSKAEKNINKIVRFSEIGAKWMEDYLGTDFDLKIDVYIFDDETKKSKNLINSLGLSDLDSFSTKGTVIYYYYENTVYQTASTIIHETYHVLQEYKFNLRNIGIGEGMATFLGYKFYEYLISGSFDDNELFDMWKSSALTGINDGDGLPSEIFELSIIEFQRFSIVTFERDPGSRYQIVLSFINYLVIKYGIDKTVRWTKNLTVENFRERFKDVFGGEFDTVQDEWLLLLPDE